MRFVAWDAPTGLFGRFLGIWGLAVGALVGKSAHVVGVFGVSGLCVACGWGWLGLGQAGRLRGSGGIGWRALGRLVGCWLGIRCLPWVAWRWLLALGAPLLGAWLLPRPWLGRAFVGRLVGAWWRVGFGGGALLGLVAWRALVGLFGALGQGIGKFGACKVAPTPVLFRQAQGMGLAKLALRCQECQTQPRAPQPNAKPPGHGATLRRPQKPTNPQQAPPRDCGLAWGWQARR